MARWVRFATAIATVFLAAAIITCARSPRAPGPATARGLQPLPAPTPAPAAEPAPPRHAPPFKGLSNVYIGALHSAHTLYTDGTMEYPGDFYSTFLPVWDWVATTPHDHSTTPEEWQSIRENAGVYNSRDFVSLVGYEWTSPVWGHMSVVYKGDPPPGLTPASSSDPAYDTPRELYAHLAAAQGLAVFAHPALPRLHIDFNRESEYRNEDVACLAGMFGFGGRTHWNVTWDYADGRSIAVRSTDNVYAGSWIKTALDRGYRLGFVGELDMHEKAIPPLAYRYTGVVADSLTREGIFEAMKKRHTYAVKSPSGVGKRVLLKATSGSHLMGDAFSIESNMVDITLRGKTDLAGFTLINLFVNGKIVQTRDVSGRGLLENFSFMLPDGDNYTFFEVRAQSDDDQMSQALTSPMFVTVGRAKR